MHFSRLSLFALLMLILIAVPAAVAALPAFPGAEGFGTDTKGGRGGQVFVVSTLAPEGPGSLREAVRASGPRIVVFNVSGYIDLKETLNINEPYLTIAGQTAPGEGVTIRGEVAVKTHDVVIRYLRFRPLPPTTPQDIHALRVDHDGVNVVIDHCSLSYGVDESFAMYEDERNPPHDVTIQWSIISDGLANSALSEEGKVHSMGALMGGNGVRAVSFHHNLLAHNNERNPRIKGSGIFDIVNNVIYDYGSAAGVATGDRGRMSINYIGNWVDPGKPSSIPELALAYGRDDDDHIITGAGFDVFATGNIGYHRQSDSLPQNLVLGGEALGTAKIASSRFAAPRVTTTSAAEAKEQVLKGAGALLPVRDRADTQTVEDVTKGLRGLKALPPAWPVVAAAIPPVDSDSDGMPDPWETERGLNPRNKGDAAGDRDGDGYTNIEEYLNAAPVYVGAVTIPREGGAFPGERVRFTASSHARSSTDAIGEMRFLVSTNLKEETYQFYGRVTQVQPGVFQASIKTYPETAFTGAVALGVGAPRKDGSVLKNRYIQWNTGESWVTVDPATKTITVMWDVTFQDAYGKQPSQSVFTYVAGRNGELDTGKYQPVDNYGWHRKGSWAVWDPTYLYRYGFFQEAYLENDGVHTQNRMCALTAAGQIDTAKCEKWTRGDLTYAIDRTARKFTGYDTYVYIDDRQQGWVSQSLIEQDGVTSWARTCPIVRTTGINWKAACPWKKVDLSAAGFGPWKAYAGYTLTQGTTRSLTQSMITGGLTFTRYRTCQNGPTGAPDFTNRCTAWSSPSSISSIQGLNENRVNGYTTYSVWNGNQVTLIQRLLSADGITEKSRVCQVVDGRPRCTATWTASNLLTAQAWAKDAQGRIPAGFTELGVVYYFPKGETVPVAFEPRT